MVRLESDSFQSRPESPAIPFVGRAARDSNGANSARLSDRAGE
jgi:hypothetical protein